MVPLLLGNKTFGISANLRHVCAVLPSDAAKPGFFRSDWRQERWNLMFAAGLVLGGLLAGLVFANPEATHLSVRAVRSLRGLGVTLRPGLLPAEQLDLHCPVVWLILSLSGLSVGFGTRYGGGCTSGHVITGLEDVERVHAGPAAPRPLKALGTVQPPGDTEDG